MTYNVQPLVTKERKQFLQMPVSVEFYNPIDEIIEINENLQPTNELQTLSMANEQTIIRENNGGIQLQEHFVLEDVNIVECIETKNAQIVDELSLFDPSKFKLSSQVDFLFLTEELETSKSIECQMENIHNLAVVVDSTEHLEEEPEFSKYKVSIIIKESLPLEQVSVINSRELENIKPPIVVEESKLDNPQKVCIIEMVQPLDSETESFVEDITINLSTHMDKKGFAIVEQNYIENLQLNALEVVSTIEQQATTDKQMIYDNNNKLITAQVEIPTVLEHTYVVECIETQNAEPVNDLIKSVISNQVEFSCLSEEVENFKCREYHKEHVSNVFEADFDISRSKLSIQVTEFSPLEQVSVIDSQEFLNIEPIQSNQCLKHDDLSCLEQNSLEKIIIKENLPFYEEIGSVHFVYDNELDEVIDSTSMELISVEGVLLSAVEEVTPIYKHATKLEEDIFQTLNDKEIIPIEILSHIVFEAANKTEDFPDLEQAPLIDEVSPPDENKEITLNEVNYFYPLEQIEDETTTINSTADGQLIITTKKENTCINIQENTLLENVSFIEEHHFEYIKQITVYEEKNKKSICSMDITEPFELINVYRDNQVEKLKSKAASYDGVMSPNALVQNALQATQPAILEEIIPIEQKAILNDELRYIEIQQSIPLEQISPLDNQKMHHIEAKVVIEEAKAIHLEYTYSTNIVQPYEVEILNEFDTIKVESIDVTKHDKSNILEEKANNKEPIIKLQIEEQALLTGIIQFSETNFGNNVEVNL